MKTYNPLIETTKEEVQEYNKTIDNFLSKRDSWMTEEDYKLLKAVSYFYLKLNYLEKQIKDLI